MGCPAPLSRRRGTFVDMPMAFGWRICFWTLVPPAISAAVCAAAAWFLGGDPRIALWVVGAVTVTAGVQVWQVQRDRQAALSQLRHPELREIDPEASGSFQPVLDEVASRLERQDAMMRLAQQS